MWQPPASLLSTCGRWGASLVAEWLVNFRAAQPGIAADRFAREILAILKALPALAAAECQAVIPFQ
jgi:hypothetical protein